MINCIITLFRCVIINYFATAKDRRQLPTPSDAELSIVGACASFFQFGGFHKRKAKGDEKNDHLQQSTHCFTVQPPLVMSLSSPTTPSINHRVNLGLITEAVTRSYAVENTKKVYDRVKREWTDFCNCITDGDDDFPTFMDAQKVSDFMFYQCFRRRQKVGGRHGGAVMSFCYDDYNAVMAQYCQAYNLWKQNRENTSFPDPGVEGVGISAIIQYRAGLKKIFETQVATNQNNHTWDKVWTIQAKNLVKIVETRKMRVKREKFDEKVTKEFAGYHAVERFDEIEQVFWDGGFDNIRSSFPYIRYRMLFLYTTSGILRCESLTKAELSDFQGLTVKKETDIDPLYVMVSQIPEGMFSL